MSNWSERRNYERYDLSTYCTAYFDHKGEQIEGLMVNISSSGAKFQVTEYEKSVSIEVDDVKVFEIHTHAGLSNAKARVCWLSRKDNHLHFGVHFLEPHTDKDDPLQVLIDSVF